MRRAALALALLLSGCAGTLTAASEHPVSVECSGDVKIVILGTVGPAPGVNGSIEGQCANGSYIRIGPVTAP